MLSRADGRPSGEAIAVLTNAREASLAMGKIRGQVLGTRWVDAHRSRPHHGVALPPPLADLVGT
eukprot:9772694-Alexandrium_andersonii.AAC.1